MNWPKEGPGSITYTAPTDAVLTQAGGASSEEAVGVITVENLGTGESASTPDLGTGLVSGALSRPIPVSQGQQYVVSTEGAVDTGSAAFWDKVYDFGLEGLAGYESSCAECDSPQDHPMLYASTGS